MISRYSTPQMTQTWDDRHRFQLWLQIEIANCQELARCGIIPAQDWTSLQKKLAELKDSGGVDPDRVHLLESTLKHDVIAFTAAVAEKIGPNSRYFHYGLTSSDIVDTGLSMQIQEAGQYILTEITQLLAHLKDLALRYQDLPCIGRTHGIYAEPTSFGLKFLGWYTEWIRNQTRLTGALQELRVGKASGAVGVSPHWGPDFEEKVLKHLGLERELVGTQVIPRDRHAQLLNAFALCGSSLERIAVELRHLQRSEVSEVMEGFQKGQKGSSAMPHKRNPISAENLTGCARLLRSYAQATLENVALWHERDISHSSVERVVLPDSSHLLHYALKRMNQLLEGLVVNREQVTANLNKAGPLVFSGHYLLELVKAGVTREQAYQWIQDCALESLNSSKKDFLTLVREHLEIQKVLTPTQLKQLGSLTYQLQHVKEIYARALDRP